MYNVHTGHPRPPGAPHWTGPPPSGCRISCPAQAPHVMRAERERDRALAARGQSAPAVRRLRRRLPRPRGKRKNGGGGLAVRSSVGRPDLTGDESERTMAISQGTCKHRNVSHRGPINRQGHASGTPRVRWPFPASPGGHHRPQEVLPPPLFFSPLPKLPHLSFSPNKRKRRNGGAGADIEIDAALARARRGGGLAAAARTIPSLACEELDGPPGRRGAVKAGRDETGPRVGQNHQTGCHYRCTPSHPSAARACVSAHLGRWTDLEHALGGPRGSCALRGTCRLSWCWPTTGPCVYVRVYVRM